MEIRKWALIIEFESYSWVFVILDWKSKTYKWRIKRFWKIQTFPRQY